MDLCSKGELFNRVSTMCVCTYAYRHTAPLPPMYKHFNTGSINTDIYLYKGGGCPDRALTRG